MSSLFASLMAHNFKEIFTEVKHAIPRALQYIGTGWVVLLVCEFGLGLFTSPSSEDNRSDQNQQIIENLEKLTEDFLSVQQGMQLLLDARQNIAQISTSMDSVTSSQLQTMIKEHSKKLAKQVRETCNIHAKELRDLHAELTQGGAKSKEDLEVVKFELTRLKNTADLVQKEMRRISDVTEWLESELGPLKEVSEAMQLGIEPLRSTVELVQAEIVQLTDRAESLQDEITPLKNANEPMQIDIKQLKELTAPMQTEIKLLKEGVEPMQTEITMLKEGAEPMRAEIQQLKEANGPLKAEIKALASSTEPMHKDIKWAKDEVEQVQKIVRPLKKMAEQMKNEVKSLTESSESFNADLRRVKGLTKEVQDGIHRNKDMTTKMKADLKPIREAALLMQTNLKPLKEMGADMKTEIIALKEIVKGFENSIILAQNKCFTQINDTSRENQEYVNTRFDNMGKHIDGIALHSSHQTRELEMRTLNKLTEMKMNSIFKSDGELTHLDHLEEGEGHKIICWKITGFGGKLLQLIQEDQCITSKSFFEITKGLKVRPLLKRSSKSGKMYIHLEFVDDPPIEDKTTLVPFMHYRSYHLLDQRQDIQEKEREHIAVCDRPLFGMFTVEDTRLPYLNDSFLCLTSELEGENQYVLNDQIKINICLYTLEFINKTIRLENNCAEFFFYTISKRIKFDLEDKRQRVMSNPYRTSEMGYFMQIELLLNQTFENEVYIIPNLKFLLGPNDSTLFCPVAGVFSFDLVDQSKTPGPNIFDKYEFGIETLISNPHARRMDDVRMPAFILQSVVDDPKYCVNDTILIKCSVHVY